LSKNLDGPAISRPSTSLQRLYVLDSVNRRDRFSTKKPLRSSARGASFHTKHALNANVVRIVLLDANSYLALSAFGVRTEKLRTFVKVSHWIGSQNLLSLAPPCFGRHVKLVPAFAVVSTHSSFKEG
jgi:hypothetical protein